MPRNVKKYIYKTMRAVMPTKDNYVTVHLLVDVLSIPPPYAFDSSKRHSP